METPSPSPAELEPTTSQPEQVTRGARLDRIKTKWQGRKSQPAADDAAPEKMSRGKRIAILETGMNIGEGLAMAAGIPVPLREVANTAGDVFTYTPEASDTPETGEKQRRFTVGRVAGMLALNLATGIAAQKGVPGLIEFVHDNLAGTPVETGVQLASKVGAMTGVTSLMARRAGG